MVACLSVCRMWRETFTPHFWKVFDDTIMVCESSILSTTRDPKSGKYKYTAMADGFISSDVRVVPLKTFCMYRHHIRYASLKIPLPEGTFLSTKLKRLDIHSYVIEADPNILLMNRSISKLYLAMMNSADYDCVQRALESLTNLTVLTITVYDFSQKNDLVTVLNNNPDLQKLEIDANYGIPTFKDCNMLLNVTKIYMGTTRLVHDSQAASTALIELLHRCPHLEIFSISGKVYTMSVIGPVIKKMCPKVHSVAWLRAGDVKDKELISLVRSADALKSIRFDSTRFPAEVSEVLLEHAATLEKLTVSTECNLQDFAMGANKILSSCSQLRSLRLSLWRPYSGPREQVNVDWLQGPLNCPKLESIELHGFVDFKGDTGAEKNRVLEAAPESKFCFRHMQESKFNETVATRGWETNQTWYTGMDNAHLALTLGFEQLWDLPCLKRVQVEYLEYMRKIDMR
ncbi:hypothetical protein BG004_008453 [Podila humilis]|nr:hypothetical protein BG004_008453 [Podila humilis]